MKADSKGRSPMDIPRFSERDPDNFSSQKRPSYPHGKMASIYKKAEIKEKKAHTISRQVP